jgi:D-inositol-3-phosphate glycosyltransferase
VKESYPEPPPRVAILTAGQDRPYALGLANALLEVGVPFDFLASDFLHSPELRDNPNVRFLNIRNQQANAHIAQKVLRVVIYYVRLICYATSSPCRVFHILWNNKVESFDRTLLLFWYKLWGRRLVFTAHNVNKSKRDGNDSWWNRFTLRVQYTLVDHIFVHTNRMREELLTEFGVGWSKVTVIPFGINSTVPETELSPAQARTRLGISFEEKTVLFFGHIAPYKGVEHLVEAMILLRNRGEHYRLVIAGRPKGSEKYWEGIQQRIFGSGLNDRTILKIEFVPDEDTEVYFKASDAFILPYTHVFQSGVLFLGYNFGLPAIATDVGSLREDIEEGRTGYVCPPNNAFALADSISAYFGGPLYADRANVRRTLRDYARDKYSWAKVALLTRAVYEKISVKHSGVRR